MQTLTYNMERWTTEELIGEVVLRTATDASALRMVEGVIIQARLDAGDRLRAEEASPLVPGAIAPPVRGTTEMGLAEYAAPAVVSPAPGHEVEAGTVDAHAHDHTHGKKAPWKLAAHLHPHLHPDDLLADGELNGHTHARAHAGLPWEHPDPVRGHLPLSS